MTMKRAGTCTRKHRMTVAEVEMRVETIRRSAKDAEAAHSREDELYEAVLRSIADHPGNARDLANAALATKAIDFPRWKG